MSFPRGRVAYDPAGNRTRETTTGAGASDKTYAYDAINRLLGIDSNVDTEDVSYQYDPNGNTTSKTKSGVTTTFHYDIRDQLGEVRESGNILGRYGYDFDGRRILKIGNEGRRQYTYDQLSVITEADPANATVSKYDYGLDQLVRLDNRTEGRSFFHLDVLGSTVGLTDAGGASRQSILYDAWGSERERIGSSANRFTFTSHEKDEETGLIYAKARFYDPDIGRFLNQDQFLGRSNNPPSLHRYAYVLQNPLIYADPAGFAELLKTRPQDFWLLRGMLRSFEPGPGGSIEEGKVTLSTERGSVTSKPFRNVLALLQLFNGDADMALTYLDGLAKIGADHVVVRLETKDFNEFGLVPNDVFQKFLDEVGILSQSRGNFLPQLQGILEGANADDLVDISTVAFAAKIEARLVGAKILDAALNPDIVIPDPSGKGPPLVIPQNEVDSFLTNFLVRNIVAAGSLTEAFGISGLPSDDQGGVLVGATMDLVLMATVIRSIRLARLAEVSSAVPKPSPVPRKPPLPPPQSNPRYSWSGHRTAAIAEEQLARTVHGLPDEVVIRWGDEIGSHGADVISVNIRTGRVTLWDGKFRGTPTRIQQSATFSKASRLQNAADEALATLRANESLPAAIRQSAIRDLQRGVYQTRTVGMGNAKNSVLQ